MIDRIVGGCLAAIAVLIAIEVLFVDMHPEGAWERFPGHMAVVGFVSHMVVVLGCKWLGKYVLERPEDFDG